MKMTSLGQSQMIECSTLCMHMTKDQQLLCLDCKLKKYHNLRIIFNDLLMEGVEQGV